MIKIVNTRHTFSSPSPRPPTYSLANHKRLTAIWYHPSLLSSGIIVILMRCDDFVTTYLLFYSGARRQFRQPLRPLPAEESWQTTEFRTQTQVNLQHDQDVSYT